MTAPKNIIRNMRVPRVALATHRPYTQANRATITSQTHMKAAQIEPKLPAKIPASFDEDLVARCFPHKFRRIGDPYGYLDEVGIESILEFIYKGNLLINVAEVTNVPLMRLRRWVEDRGYYQQIEDAETQSADGYLAQAHYALKNAPTEFELRRAKELMKYAQFMAENKNKHVYGGGVGKEKKAPVHYEFVIGTNAAPETVKAVTEAVIEGESRRLEKDGASDKPTTVSLAELFPNLADLKPKLVAPRPITPTPENPDVGPFFDDPTDQANTQLPEYYSVT